ncbi:hypothetical protein VI03_25720 [Burkholderia vietnamiensis]|nr:hypothetical protein VI03_25720 [Burkholderia vietnamiensis]
MSLTFKVLIAFVVAALAYGLAILTTHERTRRTAEFIVPVIGIFGTVVGVFILGDASWREDALSCWVFLFAGAILLLPFVKRRGVKAKR